MLIPSPGGSKGKKYHEIQEQRENTTFLRKYLGFAINSLLQGLPSQLGTFCISKLAFSMQMLLSSQTWAPPWSRELWV